MWIDLGYVDECFWVLILYTLLPISLCVNMDKINLHMRQCQLIFQYIFPYAPLGRYTGVYI